MSGFVLNVYRIVFILLPALEVKTDRTFNQNPTHAHRCSAHNAHAVTRSERQHTTWLHILNSTKSPQDTATANDAQALLPALQLTTITLASNDTDKTHVRLFCAPRYAPAATVQWTVLHENGGIPAGSGPMLATAAAGLYNCSVAHAWQVSVFFGSFVVEYHTYYTETMR